MSGKNVVITYKEYDRSHEGIKVPPAYQRYAKPKACSCQKLAQHKQVIAELVRHLESYVENCGDYYVDANYTTTDAIARAKALEVA